VQFPLADKELQTKCSSSAHLGLTAQVQRWQGRTGGWLKPSVAEKEEEERPKRGVGKQRSRHGAALAVLEQLVQDDGSLTTQAGSSLRHVLRDGHSRLRLVLEGEVRRLQRPFLKAARLLLARQQQRQG
jgi:hypothetical protein